MKVEYTVSVFPQSVCPSKPVSVPEKALLVLSCLNSFGSERWWTNGLLLAAISLHRR